MCVGWCLVSGAYPFAVRLMPLNLLRKFCALSSGSAGTRLLSQVKQMLPSVLSLIWCVCLIKYSKHKIGVCAAWMAAELEAK